MPIIDKLSPMTAFLCQRNLLGTSNWHQGGSLHIQTIWAGHSINRVHHLIENVRFHWDKIVWSYRKSWLVLQVQVVWVDLWRCLLPLCTIHVLLALSDLPAFPGDSYRFIWENSKRDRTFWHFYSLNKGYAIISIYLWRVVRKESFVFLPSNF